MAVFDPEIELPPPHEPALGPRRHGIAETCRRRPLLTGLPIIAVGVFAVVLSLEEMSASTGLVRFVALGVGIAMVFGGLKLVCRHVFGPFFDLGLWLSFIWLFLLGALALLVDFLPISESRDVSAAIATPIRQPPDLLSAHPLGTDGQGLDILGGIAYGARVSLTIGIGAALIGITVGMVVGIAAGYFRGKLDAAVSFLTDSMLAFPPLILLLAMVAALSPTVGNVTVALAILAIPTYIRLSRANTLTFAQREFVLAARALGERHRAIMTREILPNVLLPVMSFSFLIIAVFIVAEASLSFLGLSVSRPNPTWGNMIAADQSRFQDFPHLVFVPGGVLFLTVLSLNRVGEYARSRWDPREAKL